MAVDAGRDAAARESRARAIRRSIGRSVVSFETPPRSSAVVHARSFVRSFVRSFDSAKTFGSNRIEIDRFRDENRRFDRRFDALHREVGILGRSRDARETNR